MNKFFCDLITQLCAIYRKKMKNHERCFTDFILPDQPKCYIPCPYARIT